MSSINQPDFVCLAAMQLDKTRSHPAMVGDMSSV